MKHKEVQLHYKKLWLVIGYSLIAFVIFETLTARPISTGLHLSDKYMHTIGYFGMMGWFVQIYHHNKSKLLWAAFFISMGISLEFIQGWSGVRFFEVNDMLANGLGVMIAWLLSYSGFSIILSCVDRFVFSKLNDP